MSTPSRIPGSKFGSLLISCTANSIASTPRYPRKWKSPLQTTAPKCWVEFGDRWTGIRPPIINSPFRKTPFFRPNATVLCAQETRTRVRQTKIPILELFLVPVENTNGTMTARETLPVEHARLSKTPCNLWVSFNKGQVCIYLQQDGRAPSKLNIIIWQVVVIKQSHLYAKWTEHARGSYFSHRIGWFVPANCSKGARAIRGLKCVSFFSSRIHEKIGVEPAQIFQR